MGFLSPCSWDELVVLVFTIQQSVLENWESLSDEVMQYNTGHDDGSHRERLMTHLRAEDLKSLG